MIFDDPAENKQSQISGFEFREGKLPNLRTRAARAPCMEKIYENLRKPARVLRARHALIFLLIIGTVLNLSPAAAYCYSFKLSPAAVERYIPLDPVQTAAVLVGSSASATSNSFPMFAVGESAETRAG